MKQKQFYSETTSSFCNFVNSAHLSYAACFQVMLIREMCCADARQYITLHCRATPSA